MKIKAKNDHKKEEISVINRKSKKKKKKEKSVVLYLNIDVVKYEKTPQSVARGRGSVRCLYQKYEILDFLCSS